MTREEILQALQTLNDFKERRVKLQQEINDVTKDDGELRYIESDVHEEKNGLVEELVGFPHLTVKYSYRENYNHGDEYEDKAYYLYDTMVAIEENIGNGIYATYPEIPAVWHTIESLENLSEEEKREKIREKIAKDKEGLISKKEVLKVELSNEDARLAELRAELESTPLLALTKRSQIKFRIKSSEEEIDEINEEILDNDRKLEALEDSEAEISKRYAEGEKFIDELKMYEEKNKKIVKLEKSLKEKRAVLGEKRKKLTKEINELKECETKIINNFAKDSASVSELIRISKDKGIPKETRAVAGKVVEAIAAQSRKKNFSRK